MGRSPSELSSVQGKWSGMEATSRSLGAQEWDDLFRDETYRSSKSIGINSASKEGYPGENSRYGTTHFDPNPLEHDTLSDISSTTESAFKWLIERQLTCNPKEADKKPNAVIPSGLYQDGSFLSLIKQVSDFS
jgi:hypothetical protein